MSSGSVRHRPGARRRHHGRRRQAFRTRLKAVLGASIFFGVIGVASADATFVRALPLYKPIAGAMESMLEQRVWLFVAGLALGLWLRHEQARPRPPLPFPLVEMRKGVSTAAPDRDSIDLS